MSYSVAADTSKMGLIYAVEDAWGIVPDKQFKALRLKGQSLSINKTTTESSEIRADRNVTDVIDTGIEAQGNLEFEISHGTYDDFFAAALFNDWSETLAIECKGNIRAIGAVNQLVIEMKEGETTENLDKLRPAQWVRLSGFKPADSQGKTNNGYYKIESVDANTLTLSGKTFIDETAESVLIEARMLKNGIKPKSFTIERQHKEIDQYFLFTGLMVSSISMNFPISAMMDGSISFLGKDGLRMDTSSSKSDVAPTNSTAIFNSVSNFANLRIAGLESVGYLRSLNLTIDNGLRGQKAIAHVGLVGIGSGRFKVSGKIEVYFKDKSLYDVYRNGESLSIDWRICDSNGAAYIFTLPHVKLSKGEIDASGNDQDVMAKFDFVALYDSKSCCTFQIDSFSEN